MESETQRVLTLCAEHIECLVQSLGLRDCVCASGDKDVLFGGILILCSRVLLGLFLQRELRADWHIVNWGSTSQEVLTRHDKEVVGLQKNLFIGLLMRLNLVQDKLPHLLEANCSVDFRAVCAFVALEIPENVFWKGHRL